MANPLDALMSWCDSTSRRADNDGWFWYIIGGIVVLFLWIVIKNIFWG